MKGKLYNSTEDADTDLMANKEYFNTKKLLDEAKKEFPIPKCSDDAWFIEDVLSWFIKWFEGDEE